MNTILQQFHKTRSRGFVLPLTLIVCIIILTIATGISIILSKELYFSKLSRLSQVAYYAADNALMCATMVDDHYIDPDTGLGIFEYNASVDPEDVLFKVDDTLTLLDIKCATSAIFDPVASEYRTAAFTRTDEAGNPDTGRTTTFSMRMDLGNGGFRCAKVEINKTAAYRQIISRGFASCGTSLYNYPVERAIISTSQTSDTGPQSSQAVYVLTSGTSWAVPQGVTTVKVWAIGGGGGGAGSIGSDSTSGGGGGAGAVTYRTYSVSGGSFNYVIGSGGAGGINSNNGAGGQTTNISYGGVNIIAQGGSGGRYNTSAIGTGGTGSGGDGSATGGTGSGASGDTGGGGGGGIGGGNGGGGNAGGTGGDSIDVSGLFAALSSVEGYPTITHGSGGGSGSSNVNNMNGTPATGFGSGGGGAGWYGGNGGNGLYGGGGGGAAGYTLNNRVGGNGGSGVIVIQTQ